MVSVTLSEGVNRALDLIVSSLITDRVHSTREGYVLTRVCPSVHNRGGRGVSRPGPYGVPQPGLTRVGVPQPDPERGYPGQV